MTRSLLNTILLMAALAGINTTAGAQIQDQPSHQAQYLDYEVGIYPNPDTGTDGILRIFQSGNTVFTETGNAYSLEGEIDFPKIGDDITGDEVPDLVVSHWSGGAHCCYDVLIFSIGEAFRLIQRIEGGHGSVHFKDLDKDGIPELVVFDWNFAYWNASFASSPAPQVILRYQDGKYVVDRELMKKPLESIKSPVADEEFRKSECDAGNAWKKDGYCLSSDVWGHMLDLIYAGHAEAAWRYLDEVWKADEATKASFVSDFKHQLALSAYIHGE